MIIDSHTHIFPKQVKQNRSKYFDNEPEFKMLYNSSKAKISTIDELIRSMDKYHIDISIACGFPWQSPAIIKQNNDIIIESVQKYPDRIKGLACINAGWDGAPDETKRCIDAGKGFAVVAGEIKALAQQTAEATNEINAKISEVQITTNESVSAIESIVKVINEINSVVTTVAAAIEEQSATTKEISNNVGQAALAVEEVNDNINQTSAVVSKVTQDISGVSQTVQ